MSGGVPTKSSFLSVADVDLSSSTGVQKLLSVVRGTPMIREDYNDLRDLIFKYKQKGNSPEIKEQIIKLLVEVGITSQLENKSNEPAVGSSQVPNPPVAQSALNQTNKGQNSAKLAFSRLGSTRISPSFSVSQKQTSQPELEKKAVKQVESESKQASEIKVNSVPPTPAQTVVTPKPKEEMQQSQEPKQQIVSEPNEVVEASSAKESTPVEPAVQYNNPLERIKEIKQAVNKKVGNPINLIDANNEVGREYMNSLLEAMKKVNGGSSAEVNSAMSRLETAYSAVEETLKSNSGSPVRSSASETKASAPAPVSESTIELENKQTPTPEREEVTVQAKAKKLDVKSTNDYLNSQKSEADTVSKKVSNIASPFVPKNDPSPATAVPHQPAQPSVVPNKGLPKKSLFKRVVDEEVVTDSAVEEPVSSEPVKAVPFQSVAKEKQLENIIHTNKQKEAQEAEKEKLAKIASMDPLMTPDIDNGLSQLLSEWSLFKSSGIFGTGPSGLDHPLYKELAQLQMSVIIAGRFEGSTPEVKQSITDYMNGWRYEEGIIHQHGETFEHYLRRVIKNIMDKRQTN